jgi:hypothetical protein
LIAEYGGDPIAEYWRGQRSLRQLRVLIENLPPSSARARKLNGHHWQDIEHLLAIVADRIAEVGVAQIKQAGGKAKKSKPLPRPGRKQPGKNTLGDRGNRSIAETKAYLDSLSAPPPPPKAVTFIEPAPAAPPP